MKSLKLVFALLFTVVLLSAFTAPKDRKYETVYIFGFSASFTDTLCYYTDIQQIDSVAISKLGFLANRSLYSYQLENYIENNGLQQNSTSMVYFSTKKNKIKKEQRKLLEKYKDNNKVAVKNIPVEEFAFTKQ